MQRTVVILLAIALAPLGTLGTSSALDSGLWTPDSGDGALAVGVVDFDLDIMPVLARAGCNAAGCHGAAAGQGGFHLSLFGSDPDADYDAITREYGGRRIDRAEPARSLVLLKPLKKVAHKGGRVLEPDGPMHRTFAAWAEQGFKRRASDLKVTAIDATGGEQIRVAAKLSDGSTRDVTALSLFASNDESIAEVDAGGRVTLKSPGETTIMVRYAGHVAAPRVGRPFSAVEPAPLAVRTFVDEHVGSALRRAGLAPSAACADDTFVRRANLAILGTLPTPDEVLAFLAKPDRGALVDALVARPEFDEYWAYRLDQVFRVSSKGMDAPAFHAWLKSRVREPWPDTARRILTATGRTPESNFFRPTPDPKDVAESVGRAFLGTRWMCAQCHDHPFDGFRRRDYYGVAAFFARLRQTPEGLAHLDRGDIVDPQTGRPAVPRYGGAGPGEGDHRLPLAAELAASRQLRRALANRVWALLMGRGLVDPVDDFRASNPPSSPELLEALAELDSIPDLVRAIAKSTTFGLGAATETNRADRRSFSHAAPKPLSAEVLLDAIARATGVSDTWPNRPPGTRAIQLADAAVPSYALDVCGRGRESFEGSLQRELHLLNGDAALPKLAGVKPLLDLQDAALVEALYLRTLSRRPSDREAAHWTGMLRKGPRVEIAEDLLWALLNSREFQTCP